MNIGPRIFADFQKTDKRDDITFALLTCVGTRDDLLVLGITFQEGMEVTLYQSDTDENGNGDPLEVDAVIKYHDGYKCWVGEYNLYDLKYRSEK